VFNVRIIGEFVRVYISKVYCGIIASYNAVGGLFFVDQKNSMPETSYFPISPTKFDPVCENPCVAVLMPSTVL